MDHVKSFIGKLDKCVIAFEQYSAAFLYLLILCLIILGAVTRNLFDYSFAWTEDLAKFLMIWVASMGCALATRKNEHVNVDLIFRFIPQKLHTYYKVFLAAVSVVFLFFFARYTFEHALSVAKTGQTSTSMLWFQMYWMYIILWICLVMMIIEFTRWTVNMLRYKPGQKEIATEEVQERPQERG